MEVLVDTNVISDVTFGASEWTDWSMDQLEKYTGRMFVNSMVFAELSCRSTSPEEVEARLMALGLEYAEVPREALYEAAQAFLLYRKRGGAKSSPLPDFFIGAHAAALGVPILTRDVARYRTYFPSVDLICP